MYNKMMLPIQLTKILYSDWQGTISISSQDSEIYGKCLNGEGSVTFKNGNKYQGNFYNGLLNGKGKFTWANGIVYEGEFTDNRITGKGVYRWPDGSVYEGEVKDGLRHGYGVYKIDEATYEGEWKEGKKEGKGKIHFKSGSIFEGNFKNDLKHGYGKMYYYPSGNFFEGNWENDMKEGEGTMNWIDLREKYFGKWHNNYQHGWGVHIWLESKGQGKYLRNRYQGNWANGVRDGFGIFYYANGSKYEGYWKDNMKQGYAFYTNENGKISHLMFDKDRMLKSGITPNFDQSSSPKKQPAPAKKQVQPNTFSQCLQIQQIFYPFKPNLQGLYNLLLRNNTQLKTWYKGLCNFYDQQSEFSFCINSEGIWKMIRALKILGDLSLADIDRAMKYVLPDVEKILKLIDGHNQSVDYEDIYYKNLASTIPKIQSSSSSEIKTSCAPPFSQITTHQRSRNYLFREFVHLLIQIAYSLSPTLEKPQKSIQTFLAKISPMLETITKSIKSGTSDNISENMSSVSKGEKNISPHFRTVNKEIFQKIYEAMGQPKSEEKGEQPRQKGRVGERDVTVRIREFLWVGKQSGVFGEQQLTLLQRIVQKYMDPQVLNRHKNQLHQNSTIPTKLLNILDYQLIQYQFNELAYFLLIKKLPSHKETEDTKQKYQSLLTTLETPLTTLTSHKKQQKQYKNQPLFLVSKKSVKKQQVRKRREKMEKNKKQELERLGRIQREEQERVMMAREDKDVKDQDFQEEESELDI